MANKTTALKPIHCNLRRNQPSQAKPRPQENHAQISWDVQYLLIALIVPRTQNANI